VEGEEKNEKKETRNGWTVEREKWRNCTFRLYKTYIPPPYR